jgi:nicotinate-nucleotide pyrophosphorylase (carboxylating)
MSVTPFPPVATWQALVELALSEDVGSGDVSSRLVIAADARGRARIEARQELVVCGLPLLAEVFRQVDPSVHFEPGTEDGKIANAGTPLVGLSGPIRSILTAERTALNFLARLSGVATQTRRYVEAVAGTGTAIVDTRKTLPGWRLLDKYAVATGGGVNHRIGLFDGILLKDNHIAAAGSMAQAVELARSQAPANLRVQVEVESLADARTAWQAGADLLLLDNRSPDEIREIRAECPDGVLLEASGGIQLDNVRAYAETGVQRISIGALTHSAPGVDVALEMEPESGGPGGQVDLG